MSKRLIVIDTGCAPTEELVEKYGVEVMGMKILLDGQTYVDGQDMDIGTYYSLIEKAKDFNTSPPLVWEIKKQYEDFKNRGYREVIGIHVSSKMSKLIATCNNARKMVPGIDVKIIDTEDMSIGAYFVAEKILELLERGKAYEDILARLTEIRRSSYIQVSLSTLKYLIKNKRVGKMKGLTGELLKLKPILGMDNEGYLVEISKERGKEKIMATISDNAIRFLENRPHNVKVFITYGLDKNKRQVDELYRIFEEKYRYTNKGDFRKIESRLTPTLANLSGPEAYGFAVYGEEKPIE